MLPGVRNRLGAIAVVVFALGIGIFLLVRGLSGDDEHFQTRRVVALPSGELLLVQREGLDNSTMDRGRLVRVDREGNALQVGERVKGALRFLALTDDRAWFQSHHEGVHQRRVSDLRIVPGTREALAAHGMLSKGHTVVGTSEGRALVLRGKDGKHYTLDASHAIEQHGRDFEYQRLPPTQMQSPDFPEVASGSVASMGHGSVLVDQADLLKPKVVLDQRTGEPMVYDDPPSALAYSLNFEGKGSSAILSRVTDGGTVLWSVPAQEAIGPVQWEGEPGFPIRWIEQTTPETLTMLVEVTSWYRGEEGDQWGVFGPYLVQLDATDGSVLSAWPVRVGLEE